MKFTSWGRTTVAEADPVPLHWMPDRLPETDRPFVAYGLGRSYGDACLNSGGNMLSVRGMNRLITFDSERGVLRAESGISFDEILRFTVPRGWFLPVTPGTRYVTLGGAIASDIHGKNHHRAGTLGRHVRTFGLLRTQEGVLECSPRQNEALFRATIGGMGLTGLILWVEIALQRIESPRVQTESLRFRGLRDFFRLSEDSERGYEFTVSWMDLASHGKNLGRGIFYRGNFARAETESSGREALRAIRPPRNIRIPARQLSWLLNPVTERIQRTMTFWKPGPSGAISLYRFFYPLDRIPNWNELYGKNGFFQYQCVIPKASEVMGTAELIRAVSGARQKPLLVVAKTFGDLASPGLLSFPMPGVTLCLDYRNEGSITRELVQRLDAVVRAHGGRVYAAKDALSMASRGPEGYPEWENFRQYIDPAFSSDFARRVGLT